MKLQCKVRYMNRDAYIVGIRQPRSNEDGGFYDLCRKPNSSRVDYKDIPGHLITLADRIADDKIAYISQNGWAMRV